MFFQATSMCFLIVICIALQTSAQSVDTNPSMQTDEGTETTDAQKTFASAESVCKEILCGGHGQCAVVQGEPECKCEQGYWPDSQTGLHCVAASTPSIVKVPVQTAPAAVGMTAADSLALERTARLQAKQYLREDEQFQKLSRRRTAGIIGTAVGGGLMAGGLFVFSFGALALSEEAILLGLGSFAVGTAVFIPSMIVMIASKRKRNRMFRDEIERRRELLSLQFSGVGPYVTPDRQGGGLSASVGF
ncbi:MAG: hypothetical protein JXX29_19670 [Deltaproteobacteria bacterium]|nr:hypothetical protein [Deltaproteobacteria bacterium]MBN2673909.1 hypothetical protein [Deltaproteobacteria bacterium]